MGDEASDTPDESFGKRVIAWVSPDGLTWQRASVERPGAKGLRAGVQDIAVGPAGLLAYADYFGQDLGRQRLWHSDDGLTWEVAGFPDAGNVVFSSLTGSPDGYLLAAAEGPGGGEARAHLWRSADGLTWVESPGPDGVPGPDPGTYLAGTATLDGVTVALGNADGRTLAWMAGHVPTGELDGSLAG